MEETTKSADRPTTPDKAEATKLTSNYLRGTLEEELANDSPKFSSEGASIIKHHGAYQQDNRDVRRSGVREYSFLVRTRFPGGKLTGDQLLAELDLCDELGTARSASPIAKGFNCNEL